MLNGTVAGFGDAETWIGGMVITAIADRYPRLATTASSGA
jgi:hypothetical protein